MYEAPQHDDLDDFLKGLADGGIVADDRRLKEDMASQFSDHREWVREFVANSCDADAKHVWIDGRESAGHITIRVADDGHGMDRAAIIDFMTVYRTRKRDAGTAIGHHGVGKLCAASIPGLRKFHLTTSTGKEGWTMETDSLLGEQPIDVIALNEVPERGTTFELSFESEVAVDSELKALRDVLNRYCRFLPLEIIIGSATTDKRERVCDCWESSMGATGRTFNISYGLYRFNILVGISTPFHEIYQSKVLVSSGYNLLSADLEEPLSLPHLGIRVDSSDFQLPFGRHNLRNEEILVPLARALRDKVLPPYMEELCGMYHDGRILTTDVDPRDVRTTACHLLRFDRHKYAVCAELPVFEDVRGQVFSLANLEKEAARCQAIYIASAAGGTESYDQIQAPVLSDDLTPSELDLLRPTFGAQLVDLREPNTVFEAPMGSGPPLGVREYRFQSFLHFHRLASRIERDPPRPVGGLGAEGATPLNASDLMNDLKRALSLTTSVGSSRRSAEDLKWKVGYLVLGDGFEPCVTKKVLVKNDTITLNLHHPEVAKLLDFSELAPELSGHWGLGLALDDPDVLPHLTEPAREDLLLVDAVAKCLSREDLDLDEGAEDVVERNEWRDFLMRTVG